MSVQHLIDKLLQLDPDMEIYIWGKDESLYDHFEVEVIDNPNSKETYLGSSTGEDFIILR